MGSDDYGRDLTGVQNVRKKHKRIEAEVTSHEPAIQVRDPPLCALTHRCRQPYALDLSQRTVTRVSHRIVLQFVIWLKYDMICDMLWQFCYHCQSTLLQPMVEVTDEEL